MLERSKHDSVSQVMRYPLYCASAVCHSVHTSVIDSTYVISQDTEGNMTTLVLGDIVSCNYCTVQMFKTFVSR